MRPLPAARFSAPLAGATSLLRGERSFRYTYGSAGGVSAGTAAGRGGGRRRRGWPGPNRRQALALEHALAELELLRGDILEGRPYDCCAVRLDTAAAHLGEVTGLDTPAQVLNAIFDQFCIGK